MLLLADGARLFEPARERRHRVRLHNGQASNSHSIVDCSPHFGHFQSGRGLPGSSADFIDSRRLFFWSGAFRNPRSEIRNSLPSDLCLLNYSHSIVLGGLLEMS